MVIVDSVVGKAVKNYYEKKYEEDFKDLPEDKKKAKIEAHLGIQTHLKNIFPPHAETISRSGMSKMGYHMGIEKAIDIINKGGFRIVYDSFSEGLEPIYYWILDFMRDTYWGTGLEVLKTMEQFEASVGSGFFGDLGTRASIMQDRATKLLGTINTVVRSIINILYDLKEFDQRLNLYTDLKSDDESKRDTARLGLKQYWMDKVDIQRGRASINMLAQQLQFITLRDAFMAVNSTDKVDKMDLNDRVKRILKPRIADYLTWEKLSGDELNRRYKIELVYLRSQVESLKLYAQWAKPYFQAAEKLKTNLTKTPDLINVFNTMVLQTCLLGFNYNKDSKMYSCVEVSFDFRTIPHTIKQTQSGVHYTQGGRVDIQFRGFALNEEEKKSIEDYEVHEALEMAKLNDDMIKQIEESVNQYLKKEAKEDVIKEEKKEKEKNKTEPGPIEALIGGFKDVSDLFKGKSMGTSSFKIEKNRKEAAVNAVSLAYRIYNVYKKGHGMYTE